VYPLIPGETGSSVGIATGYGLDGPGIESRWERDFPHLYRTALGPTQPLVQWVPGLSQSKERPERDADPSSLLVPWSRKGRGTWYTSTPPMGLTACTEPQCLYKNAIYHFLPHSRLLSHLIVYYYYYSLFLLLPQLLPTLVLREHYLIRKCR
jgi:hypothetical protein